MLVFKAEYNNTSLVFSVKFNSKHITECNDKKVEYNCFLLISNQLYDKNRTLV